jgi:hypothetical protein
MFPGSLPPRKETFSVTPVSRESPPASEIWIYCGLTFPFQQLDHWIDCGLTFSSQLAEAWPLDWPWLHFYWGRLLDSAAKGSPVWFSGQCTSFLTSFAFFTHLVLFLFFRSHESVHALLHVTWWMMLLCWKHSSFATFVWMNPRVLEEDSCCLHNVIVLARCWTFMNSILMLNRWNRIPSAMTELLQSMYMLA